MSLAVTGVPSSWRAPITAAELLFGQGASTASASRRYAMYCGPKTSAGSATVNLVYQIRDELDARTLFGAGSPLHRQLKRHLESNKRGPLYAVCYAASSGAGSASATGTFTVTISTITSSGILTFSVCEEEMSVGFNTSSTTTTIGDAIAAKINSAVWLPVTAGNSGGVVTLTAKIAGASQNAIYRLRIDVDPGKGVTVAKSAATVGVSTGVAGADGATAEDTNLIAALAVVDNVRYYYMGVSTFSATHLGRLKTHLANKSLPMPGLRSRGFAGAVGTLSATSTIATGLNYERVELAWQENSDSDPATLAANNLAIHQLEEEQEPDNGAFNFDGYSEPFWLVKRSFDTADWPSPDDLNDAVTDGITPIQSKEIGSYLVMSVNTRSKDSTGALDDFRASETHRVSCLDWFMDTVITQHQQTFKGWRIQEDPRNADLSINRNVTIPPKTITPETYRPWFTARISRAVGVGLLQRLDEWVAATDIRVDPSNHSRLQVGTSGRVADVWHQTTWRISETTPN